ncbi:MAG: IS66 family transposase [Acetobacteraceae bacterium]
MAPTDDTHLPEDDAAAAAIGAGSVALEAENAALRAEIAGLLARVAELERRLGLNSANSGKPPSSDGLKKPSRNQSLRGATDKKTGGQPGHPGKTLCQIAKPDLTIDHFPSTCATCGGPLSEAVGDDYLARQVFDLPQPAPLVVTEHRAHRCRCAACGTQTRAAFPAAVSAPAQYGARIAAFVVYLMNYQFVPEDRLATLMADLFAVTLSRATIGQMSRRAAEQLAGFAEAVREQIVSAPVKHLDETGFRIGGHTKWLHIAATLWLTFYRVAPKRGDLLAGVSGIIVHDHWKPYYTMASVRHALCNAHHLRELQALVEIEHEGWARRMQVLLRRACHATDLARDQKMTLPPRLIDLISRRYDAVVAEGMALHAAQPPLAIKPNQDGSPRGGRPPRRIGHNLLLRLRDRKQDVLRFLGNPDVPFTNNQAERDARMMKLRQKISGGFRSDQGACDFAVIRTMIGTAKKNGWDVIQCLLRNPQDLIANLSSA